MISIRFSLPCSLVDALAVLSLLALAVSSPARLSAADGDLDLSFGHGAGVRAGMHMRSVRTGVPRCASGFAVRGAGL